MTEERAKLATDQVRIVEVPDAQVGLRAGVVLEEFEIEALIGRGGVSEVYRARDTRTQSMVALKFLLPDRLSDLQSCERLRNEAQSIMSLRHRNIVSVVDIRENDDTGPYIVMELLEGKNLTEFLPLKQGNALDVCSRIADALAYAHSRGMIHRDIKPSNVMILKDGNVKLVDFGLAKVFEPENPKHIPLTRTTELVGTPLYMSPEQCFGQDVDARSDVYQLGCLLYQCLTGLPPFEGSNSFEAMFKHVSKEANYDNLPKHIADVLKRAMHKNPSERFPDMSHFAYALREVANGKSVSTVKSQKSFGAKSAKVFVGSFVAIGATFCLILGGISFSRFITGDAGLSSVRAAAYYEEGLNEKMLGHTEKSRDALQKAIKLDRGVVGFKALSYLRSHLPAHPVTEEAEDLNIIGYNLDHSGNENAAEDKWLDCIQKYPDFEWPYSNLASLYMRRGQPQLALPLLNRALEINPYYTNALANMSKLQESMGNREKAREFLLRAAESDPSDEKLKEEAKAYDVR